MLRVRELEAFYGASQALFGMELGIDAGEVVTLMGRNGMGKTTTVSTIMGLLPAGIGRVYDATAIERGLGFRCATDFAAILAAMRAGDELPFEHDAAYVSPKE